MTTTFRRLAGGLMALVLTAPAASAADVAGWYAGIYAGGAHGTDIAMRNDNYLAQLFGPGVVETPSGYFNDAGVDPDFFDFLNLGPQAYAFADAGSASSLLTEGRLEMLGGPLLGAVTGYSFGNGLRVEADVSATSLSAGLFTSTHDVFEDVYGEVDPRSGVWTWTNLGKTPTPSDVPAPQDDFGIGYKTSLKFLLVNGFYDFDTGTVATPYVGAGIGAALMTTDCSCATPARTQIAPAAQIGAGVRIALSDPVTLDIGYRYKIAAGADYNAVDTTFDGFGGYEAVAYRASGVIGIHTLQAGLIFALK